MNDAATMLGLLLSTDLMFASRVTAAAKQRGAQVRVVGSVDSLLDSRDPQVRLVMIDLFGLPASEWEAAVTHLRELDSPPHVVAYGPHVDDTVLAAARAAGCHEVLTRGQFHQQMGELIKQWLT